MQTSLCALSLSFVFLSTSCSNKQMLGDKLFLTKDKGEKELSINISGGAEMAYLIRATQLKDLRQAINLTYLGSDSVYHFMRVWNKLSYPQEINFAAVRLSECEVEDPMSVEAEQKYMPENYGYHPWRPVEIHRKPCYVAGWQKKEYIRNIY